MTQTYETALPVISQVDAETVAIAVTSVPEAIQVMPTVSEASPLQTLNTELIRTGRIAAEATHTLESADTEYRLFNRQVELIQTGYTSLRDRLAQAVSEYQDSAGELERLRDKDEDLSSRLVRTEQNISTTQQAIRDRQHAISLLKQTDGPKQQQHAADDEYFSHTPQTDAEREEMMNLAYQLEQPLSPPKARDGQYRTAEKELQDRYHSELKDLEAYLNQQETSADSLHFYIDRVRVDIATQIKAHYQIEADKNDLTAQLDMYIKTYMKNLPKRIRFARKMVEAGAASMFDRSETEGETNAS